MDKCDILGMKVAFLSKRKLLSEFSVATFTKIRSGYKFYMIVTGTIFNKLSIVPVT